MTDRELLELAAKAARYEIEESYVGGGERKFYRKGELIPWNPLEDDGDALRLAVKLRVALYYDLPFGGDPEGVVQALINADPSRDIWRVLAEVGLSGDANASVRFAIVRAAAEIGKGM